VNKPPKTNVPQPSSQKAEVVEVAFAKDLAQRTLARLAILFEDKPMNVGFEEMEAARACLEEAFREANCDHSLFSVTFWDLAGNTRINGTDAEGEPHVIPATSLPPVGTVINYSGVTYYIASHKEQA
jgi:hypothetical protein